MPENTIASTATRIHTDLDTTRSRQAARGEQRVQQETSTAGDATGKPASGDGVQITLSEQARDLQLNSTEIVRGAGETASSDAIRARSNDEASGPATSEDGASGSVTRQFNQSANDALGTVIDIRS